MNIDSNEHDGQHPATAGCRSHDNFNDRSSSTTEDNLDELAMGEDEVTLRPAYRPTDGVGAVCRQVKRSLTVSVPQSPTRQPSPAPMTDAFEFSIDPDTFKELPADIQQEILLQQVAEEKRANDAAIQEALALSPTSTVTVQSPGSSRAGWVCASCTFANHPEVVECEICDAPCPRTRQSRSISEHDELVAKVTKQIQNSPMSKSLKKIRVPATPAATSLTQKEAPTAEDLLIAASVTIHSLHASASQNFQRLMGKTSSARSASHPDQQSSRQNENQRPSEQAIAVLDGLQRDLNLKCGAGDALYESLLVRLWDAIYQSEGSAQLTPLSADTKENLGLGEDAAKLFQPRPFERPSDGWVTIGFQGPNPDSDFRGGGMLALKCLVYAFEASPRKMLTILRRQQLAMVRDTNKGTRWYPVCVAGVNLTCVLAGLLRLGNGNYEQTGACYWPLFEDPVAFYQLFVHSFAKLDAAWNRMNASFMEFGAVLKATRRMAVSILDHAPINVDELRVADEKTLIDRFVISASSDFLDDTESGECPDPRLLLEDENEVLLSSPRIIRAPVETAVASR